MILISIEDGTCPSSTNLIKSIRAENFFISPATRSFDETQRKSTLSSTPPHPLPTLILRLYYLCLSVQVAATFALVADQG